MPLPEAFINKMSRLLGDESDAFFKTYKQKRAFGLRMNPLKRSDGKTAVLSRFHLRSVPFCPTGYYYPEADEPGKSALHQAGLYYIQEPSAMFVAETLDARPGERVLDLCAAPGGKSTQIAGAMHNQGLLVSNEPYPKRAKALSENIERMGITNTLVTNETPERLADYFPGNFDRVLVDAPCSGEGMFRKDPDAAQYWSPAHVTECAALQKEILEQAITMLRPGGVLVYSTCTFSPEEDERQIEQVLQNHPEMELVPIVKSGGIEDGRPEWTESGNPQLRRTARLWPHQLEGEGHFVAKLRKSQGDPGKKIRTARPAGENQLKDFRTFETQTLTQKLGGRFYAAGSQLYLLPDSCPEFGRLKVIRAGLHLGELKKNRFEPNHSLALALQTSSCRNLFPLRSRDDEERYLRGETLPVSSQAKKGWTLVTIDGFPLGWGKVSGGMLKNFYPKGLRRRGLNHES
ncbi:RsmF rRNA methyltransferase first C-terminal domain-containing protein [Sporolactobacillus vineae]|uniref:RsmF rRNA methyltransferase first C-terminal domain-containing protein n=1 Tax=Sporolactobacillus vineae TaxID=444463 RepID=UPI000289A529|nr:RsmF rRNA methyltransferase first C-terminal domain-containing protein [Sporolactobacillus vineae]